MIDIINCSAGANLNGNFEPNSNQANVPCLLYRPRLFAVKIGNVVEINLVEHGSKVVCRESGENGCRFNLEISTS